MLYNYCLKTKGEIWECGVYKGGIANALAGFGRTLRLFDSFEGTPEIKIRRIPRFKFLGNVKIGSSFL